MSEISREEKITWLIKSIAFCDGWLNVAIFPPKSPIVKWARESKEMMQAILSEFDGPSEEERKEILRHFNFLSGAIGHHQSCGYCNKIRDIILGNPAQGKEEE